MNYYIFHQNLPKASVKQNELANKNLHESFLSSRAQVS
jgi:hypothetical protein